MIAAGYAGGTWAGNGITSGDAAGRPAGRAVGYGEASDILSAAGGVFQGQAADGSSVVIRYTVAGDASLDGLVNFDDLLRLAKHYNGTGASATWAFGDFTFDQVVNFDDLLVLAKNYNGVLTGAAAVPGAPAGFDADVAAAFAQAAVPEPAGGVAAVVAGGFALLGGRGSRQRRRR